MTELFQSKRLPRQKSQQLLFDSPDARTSPVSSGARSSLRTRSRATPPPNAQGRSFRETFGEDHSVSTSSVSSADSSDEQRRQQTGTADSSPAWRQAREQALERYATSLAWASPYGNFLHLRRSLQWFANGLPGWRVRTMPALGGHTRHNERLNVLKIDMEAREILFGKHLVVPVNSVVDVMPDEWLPDWLGCSLYIDAHDGSTTSIVHFCTQSLDAYTALMHTLSFVIKFDVEEQPEPRAKRSARRPQSADDNEENASAASPPQKNLDESKRRRNEEQVLAQSPKYSRAREIEPSPVPLTAANRALNVANATLLRDERRHNAARQVPVEAREEPLNYRGYVQEVDYDSGAEEDDDVRRNVHDFFASRGFNSMPPTASLEEALANIRQRADLTASFDEDIARISQFNAEAMRRREQRGALAHL